MWTRAKEKRASILELVEESVRRAVKQKNERLVFKTMVRPAMLFSLETVALKKRQEAELEYGGQSVQIEVVWRRDVIYW